VRSLNMGKGWLKISWAPCARSVYYLMDTIPLSEIIHPNLQFVATTFAQWRGQEAFHAGAVLINGKLWGLLGDRGTGKSTILAQLNLHFGFPVLSDDVLVFLGRNVCAGPRLIGLRPSTKERLHLDPSTNYLQLSPVEAEYPLHGWLVLQWSRELSYRKLTPREIAFELTRHYLIKQKPLVLDLMLDLPAWKIRRPRVWADESAIIDIITKCVEAH
jgi:hypothetical protein